MQAAIPSWCVLLRRAFLPDRDLLRESLRIFLPDRDFDLLRESLRIFLPDRDDLFFVQDGLRTRFPLFVYEPLR